MNRLEKITIFNSPCERKEVVFSLDQERNILVLTGYNGVGKSRVLSTLLELMSLIHGVDYGEWSEDWLVKLEFEGGYNFHGIKIDTSGVIRKKGWEKSIRRILENPKPLPAMFSSSMNAMMDTTSKKGFSSKQSDDENNIFCALQLNLEAKDKAKFASGLRAVGFINDRVVFGYKRDSEDSVFDRKELENSINKTLYVLIKEFVATEALRSDVEQDIDRYINEFLSRQDDSKSKAELLKDTRDYVLEMMKHQDIYDKDEGKFSSNPVFVAINNILALTTRKLVWKDALIGVELQCGKFVPWTHLSRGEKTLLALFLLVYLHRDGALFILDEPDLSLHLEWQKMLLPSLLELAPTCQFIVATHSPFLVMNTGSEQIVNMAKLVSQVA
ncbi:ATP-binding protein [Pseudomonas mosselii]|uniref:AAA family ATPase n=1 Tax=Pseudomonas mosselii TaxID=78327 RepID=UPI001FF7F0A2|nr:AAA family ATPase [Pseudomonas mosselii]UPF02927.1 ATP-binding protein [Pseudomonas mosselii]